MTAHTKTIGDIVVTTLSDGVLNAPLDVVLGMEKVEVERLAGRKDNLPISVNAFLLRLAGRLEALLQATRAGLILGEVGRRGAAAQPHTGTHGRLARRSTPPQRSSAVVRA